MNGLVPQTELMDKDTYLRRAVEITDLSLNNVTRNKALAYQRLHDLMARDQLAVANASPADVRQFLNQHKQVVGKINDSDAHCFRVYDGDNELSFCQVMEDQPDVLEEYVIQHPAYGEIYDKSVNTLRIHTARNSLETRLVFKPILSIGAAESVTDHPICDKAARVLLEEDGTIIAGVDRWRCYKRMDCHPDTGYKFVPGRRLPFVREACEMCLSAAERFPELRYLGWDVAVTAKGPVVIEVNSISGLVLKYCSCSEIEEMFSFVCEEVAFCHDILFRAKRFAPRVEGAPDKAEAYLACLQVALHRHGVEFSKWGEFAQPIKREVPCVFVLDAVDSALSVEVFGRKASFSLDVPSGRMAEGDIYKLESSAMRVAAEIYSKMITLAGC